MKSPYTLIRASFDEKWNAFISASPQGTIFSRKEFLEVLDAWPKIYYCMKNNEIKAALLLFTDAEDSKRSIPHELVIYHGVLHSPPTTDKNQAQIRSDQFAVMEFIAEKAMEKFKTVHLAMHPSIADMRPFLWVNYHNSGPKYNATIRYTSYLNIQEFKKELSFEDMVAFRNMATLRRRELRRARRDGVVTTETKLTDELVDFHMLTMKRQQIPISTTELEEIRRIIERLSETGLGRMFVARNARGEVGSIVFFGLDEKRAYYIFGAGNPEAKDSHTGTAIFWDAFTMLAQSGVLQVDLEGVNSPQRGWFKLGFGGDLRTYYWIEKTKASIHV